MPADEQYEVYRQLEELQKRDWKELTVDEKKAGMSFYQLLRVNKIKGEREKGY